MTQNEIQERVYAQHEKCRLCAQLDGNFCVSLGEQKLTPPPEDFSIGRNRASEVHDRTFVSFGYYAHNIPECWQPTIAAASCIGYRKRSKL